MYQIVQVAQTRAMGDACEAAEVGAIVGAYEQPGRCVRLQKEQLWLCTRC
jgi:hypothetical protein